MRRLSLGLVLGLLLSSSTAFAQMCGGGNCVAPTPPTSASNDQIATTAYVNNVLNGGLPLPSGKVYIGSAGGIATAQTVSGDCTLATTGAITCLKTNGVFFGTASNQNIGTSGATVPFMSNVNTWTAGQILPSPNITTPTGIVKGDVGLGNVDNTSDANKPVSTATSTALGLKSNIASPTFTGTPAAPTAAAGTSTTQLATTAFAIGAVGNVKQQRFTATGTYTPSAGLKFARVEVVGPAGAGGGTTGAGTDLKAGGGGGSGGYSRCVISAASIGASQAVTIGTGGAGVSNATGNAGSGSSSLGTLCIANAGQGGALNNGSTSFGAGGAGGTVWAGAGANDFAVAGAAGMYGPLYFTPANAPTLVLGGGGAPSHFGGGAPGSAQSTGNSAPGNNATICGAGGSGGISFAVATNTAGGSGANGCVIITEFTNQ